MLEFNNMSINPIHHLPIHHSNFLVKCKNGKKYLYKKTLKNLLKKINIFGFDCIFMEFYRKSDKMPRNFVFVHTDKGIYVSDQMNSRLIPSDKMQKHLADLTGIDYIPSEIKNTEKLIKLLKQTHTYYGEYHLQHKLDLTWSNRGTKKEYKNWYKVWYKKDYTFDCAFLRTDILVKNIHQQNFIIEFENSKHKKHEFKWKLLKLKGLENKVSGIVFVFKESNMDYHLEIIAEFRRETGRKFRKLYWTTIERLERGEEPELFK